MTGDGRGTSVFAPVVFLSYVPGMTCDAFTLGDFLIESRCARGHASSVSFRGYARPQVELVAELLSESCAWRIFDDGTTCGADATHTVEELGPSDEDAAKLRAFRTAETLPAMQAVRPEEAPPGPRSSYPPPSSSVP